MSQPVISVENLSKSYLIGHRAEQGGIHRYTALRDVVGRELRNAARKTMDVVRGRQIVQGDTVEEFWALKDVSFEMEQGEVLGIIGRNGAGKSTLLKILSRITEPTKGRVTLRGRVASLLEVGTGFHPELTGRENIYLNGAILGMSRAEIRKKFDDIVAFAEVERFLDTPVKRYSSGMYVRLAFAVAAHLEPEILVVDEVLAVGDVEFQKKCLGKMDEVSRRDGRTVLYVSHNMTAIRSLCDRAVVLRAGQAVFDGVSEQAIEMYAATNAARANRWMRPHDSSSEGASFTEITISVDRERVLSLSCEIEIAIEGDRLPLLVALDITDVLGNSIMQALPAASPFVPGERGRYKLFLDVVLPPLIPATYWLTFWMGPHNNETSDEVRSELCFDITESPTPGRTFPHTVDHGYIVPISRYRIEQAQPAVEDAP